MGTQTVDLTVTIGLRLTVLPTPSGTAPPESSSSPSPPPYPARQSERDELRAQLERLVSSSLFRNSKRYPAFLCYVVDAALSGRTELLKERTLGVEIFGRQPDYDTNTDHIVRSTASDVRRRLAQYYSEPAHAGEPRIDLLSGSYVPTFRPATESEPEPATKSENAPAAAPKRGSLKWVAAMLSCVLALALLYVVLSHRRTSSASEPALDAFWSPLTSAANPAVLCIGSGKASDSAMAGGTSSPQPPYPPSATLADLHSTFLASVPLSDAVALTRVVSQLSRAHKSFRVLFEPGSQLADLRQGPVVLIGLFDNAWTIRLTGPLRYNFTFDNHGKSSIEDRQNPGRPLGTVLWNQPYLELKEDFAIVSRVFDPTTEQPILTAGGITRFGTMAAGEFLGDERCMEELVSVAPKDWRKRDIQVVLATRVIRGSSGAPHIIATHFW